MIPPIRSRRRGIAAALPIVLAALAIPAAGASAAELRGGPLGEPVAARAAHAGSGSEAGRSPSTRPARTLTAESARRRRRPARRRAWRPARRAALHAVARGRR